MRAFHCSWTAPVRVRHGSGQPYFIEDFDILTTILSALKWRDLNGPIRLYTDEIGAEYYSRIGLTGLWDLGVDTGALQTYVEGINPRSFWAAGKLVALRNEPCPCVMIDTDFIVWRPLTELASHPDLVVIHREPLYDGVYLPPHHLKTTRGYRFDPNWSWTEMACNTALVFLGSDEFRIYYVSEALRFMQGNGEEAKEAISQMVFAEQRLLGMCADAKGISIGELMPCDPQVWQQQTSFTHVWGYKDQMRKDAAKREAFCRRCVDRILRDYPDFGPVLAGIPEVQPYLGGAPGSLSRPLPPSDLTYCYRFPSGGYGLLP